MFLLSFEHTNHLVYEYMKNLQKLAYTYHFKIIHKKAMGTFIYNSMKCLLVACGTLVDSNNTCTVWRTLQRSHCPTHTHMRASITRLTTRKLFKVWFCATTDETLHLYVHTPTLLQKHLSMNH